MSMYSLVVPPEYLSRLAEIREETGLPIRRQILNALDTYLDGYEESRPPFLKSLGKYTRPEKGESIRTSHGKAVVVRVKGYGETLEEMNAGRASDDEIAGFTDRARNFLGREERYFDCLICHEDGESEWIDWSEYLAMKNKARKRGTKSKYGK